MTLEKVISGGQTGADRGGLWGAKGAGVETGGVAPQGFRTERGNEPHILGTVLGLVENGSSDYRPRTHANIQLADGTVLFGRVTEPGTKLTLRICRDLGKPDIINPTCSQLAGFILHHQVKTLTVAGNRESKNPGLERYVDSTVGETIKALRAADLNEAARGYLVQQYQLYYPSV